MVEKWCALHNNGGGAWLAIDEFGRCADGVQTYCRDCNRAYQREWFRQRYRHDAEFRKKHLNRMGHRNRASARARKWLPEQNRDVSDDPARRYWCNDCHRKLKIDRFYVSTSKSGRRRVDHICKTCKSKVKRENYRIDKAIARKREQKSP